MIKVAAFGPLFRVCAVAWFTILGTIASRADCAPDDAACMADVNELPSGFGGPAKYTLRATAASTTGTTAAASTPTPSPKPANAPSPMPTLTSSPTPTATPMPIHAAKLKSVPAPTAPATPMRPRPASAVRIVPPNTEAGSLGPSKAGNKCASRVADPALPFSISFDGKPVDGARAPNAADSQYCTDLALQRAAVQVRYDGFTNEPSLNVTASPNAVNRGAPVTFTTATNYALWLERREIRIFKKDASPTSAPFDVVPLSADSAKWVAPPGAGEQVTYVFRVYDKQGRYDETAPKILNIADGAGGARPSIDPGMVADNNSRRVKNIPVVGGTIFVSGRDIPTGGQVTVMGLPTPVDAKGEFAVRQILPTGPHDVDVAISDANGAKTAFTRSANIPDHDFFYVGLADLTAGTNHVSGPIRLLAPDQADNYRDRYFVDGRLAFYLKGKVLGDTLITAAADTQNQPVRLMFSNFDSKDPQYLLRNLDPNRYYPVYGDDSTLVEDAPTRGKFYVRIERGQSSILWGNFKTTVNGTEYVRYERGLYGAHIQSKMEQATRFGESRGQIEGFAAEPGTFGVRDVFLGTGGSLFYLSRQNITQGSEQVTIELRDAVTGLVLQSKVASATQDYDINYLQGRLVLKTTLSSTGADDFIIHAGSSSGTRQYLVVNYEYAPGLTITRDKVIGGRASYWVNDFVQVAATGYDQTGVGERLEIAGADVTMRLSPLTYLKMEIAASNGPGNGENVSIDGGFTFSSRTASGKRAFARRVEAAINLADIFPNVSGQLAAFWKQKDDGFSGPGELAINRGARESGMHASVKINEDWALKIKLDSRSDEFRDYTAGEIDIAYAFAKHWRATVGLRIDGNVVNSLTASPDLNQAGRRIDSALRIDYLSGRDWGLFAYGQTTDYRTGRREPDNRVGVGGDMRFSERLTGALEVSEGNQGFGAKLGLEYKSDETRTAYINYGLNPDRTDIIERGGLGLLTTGASQRYGDDLSVFGEQRVRYGGGYSGMTHAFGLDFTPVKDWKTGLKFETGKLTDPISGTVLRTAISPSLSYTHDNLSYAGRLEYRHDDTTAYGALATSHSVSNTYLMNNQLIVKMNPDWRLIGRLNGSYSNANQTSYFQGNYLEAVTGFAYRPVANDKLNLLFKYTYFYNVPAPGQTIASPGVSDYAQQSHVLSIDGIYDVNRWFAIGAKYALRTGSLRDNTIPGSPWYDNTTQLMIAHVDFHVVKQWDAVAELRRLSVSGASDHKIGALVAVYRQMNDNFKLGVGYNFTNYSDDLTNLSTKNRGVFVNAVGMF